VTALAYSLLAVMLLSEPTKKVDVKTAAAVSEDADRVEVAERPLQPAKAEFADIRSVRSDFDRKNGVAFFEQDVIVVYGDDYTLCADNVYAFFAASNQLSRIVAVGHVTITNEMRVGSCAMATYRRRKGEIEMFGGGDGKLAHLSEGGKNGSELDGTRIKFWIDSEQIEVDNSTVTTQAGGGKVL